MWGWFWKYGIVGLLGGVNIGIFFALLYEWFRPGAVLEPPMTRADYLDLSLAVLGVILAALGIGLAVLGVIGYNAIRQVAEDRAEKVAQIHLDSYNTQGKPADAGTVPEISGEETKVSDVKAEENV